MLARYRIIRGKRPPDEPLPDGIREDTRKHTNHVLHPEPKLVAELLADVDAGWPAFQKGYRALLKARFAKDPKPFEQLAERARHSDVYLGCNCPTQRQPEIGRCHTVLALEFMRQHFPDLKVVFPRGVRTK